MDSSGRWQCRALQTLTIDRHELVLVGRKRTAEQQIKSQFLLRRRSGFFNELQSVLLVQISCVSEVVRFRILRRSESNVES
jgi:hypothetical protein